MATFRCLQSGTLITFTYQHDIDSMKGHEGYVRVDEEKTPVKPQLGLLVCQTLLGQSQTFATFFGLPNFLIGVGGAKTTGLSLFSTTSSWSILT